MSRWTRTDARLARPARTGASRTTTLVRHLLLLACASVLALPALAAPLYRMTWERSGYGFQYNVQQSTPFQHADSYPVPDGSEAIFFGSAFAYPGHVGVYNRLEHLYSSGPQRTSVYQVRSCSSTDDFLISGPGAWVEGQLHLRARGSLSRSGAQAARLNVDARARNGDLIAMGDLIWNDTGTSGTGILAGLTSPDLDFPFVVSGSFPVGTQFSVSICLFGLQNSRATLPAAWTETDAGSNWNDGLFLEEVGGQILTLPAGYTLNSASWGVVDNHFQSIVGVDPRPARDAGQISAHPNPFTTTSVVSFEQPRAGHVRLEVFDLGGRRVRTLADEWRVAGAQSFRWDGRNNDGSVAPAGLYFARVETDGRTASRRVVRVR